MSIGDGSVLADALALVGKGAGWSSSTCVRPVEESTAAIRLRDLQSYEKQYAVVCLVPGTGVPAPNTSSTSISGAATTRGSNMI